MAKRRLLVVAALLSATAVLPQMQSIQSAKASGCHTSPSLLEQDGVYDSGGTYQYGTIKLYYSATCETAWGEYYHSADAVLQGSVYIQQQGAGTQGYTYPGFYTGGSYDSPTQSATGNVGQRACVNLQNVQNPPAEIGYYCTNFH